jgi:hypothetical protein
MVFGKENGTSRNYLVGLRNIAEGMCRPIELM